MAVVNIHYLREKFNFNTSALNSDSAYQYVYHEHPVAVISAATEDSRVWHESGVFVELGPKDARSSRPQGPGGRPVSYYLDDKRTYRYLLDIHAFTLWSPEFDFLLQEITTLVHLYFFKVNSVFPIVHEQRFWDDYHTGKQNSSMMYAMVLVILRDRRAEPLLKEVFLRSKNNLASTSRVMDHYSQDEFYADLAYLISELELKIRQIDLILPKLGDVDKMNKLVVRLLLSLHYRADKLGNEMSSHDVTTAINLAVSLAIHMRPVDERVSKERAEYLANLWWCCFIFDRFNAVTNSRSLFIRHEDFNVDLPYSNMNLLRMVQLARAFENMLVAIYRPYNNIHMVNLNNDVKTRLDLFDVDEFRTHEFDFCDKDIAAGSAGFAQTNDLSAYVSNTMRLMTRLVNNMMIIVSQKMRFDNPAIDKCIPRTAMVKAATNVLWYLRKTSDEDVMQIPLVIWTLMLSMGTFLKVRAMKLMNHEIKVDQVEPQYALEDFLVEFEKYSSRWWVVDEVANLTKDFLGKLELRTETSAKKQKVDLGIQRNSSMTSIQNIINQDERHEYDGFFEPLHVDVFDTEFFKDVQSVINIL